MAVASRGRGDLAVTVKRYQDRETSPERTKVWVEPKPKGERKVPVVYYLSRNGLLEHPHFMEVPLSSSDGLYLRDVINRLNFLRGKGMASMYAWSSKRGYRNGFVWHDLSENDFIYPAQGHEYVLKGSELLLPTPISSASQDSVSSGPEKPPEVEKPTSEERGHSVVRRRNQSWSHLDLTEYKVYKAESMAEAGMKAADASTQTDDKTRRRRKPLVRPDLGHASDDQPNPTKEDSLDEEAILAVEETELTMEEISPPPSSSSPDTLESLIKADGRVTLSAIDGADIRDRTARDHPSGRMKASTVLMQLISCGSISVKDHGFSLVSHYKGRLPRGGSGSGSGPASDNGAKETESVTDTPGFNGIRLEDKEYFSGSVIETNKESGEVSGELQGLQRSSSYNADRSSKSDLMEKEVVEGTGVTAKCMPRKPKRSAFTKDSNSAISRSNHGSKRITEEAPK